MIPLPFTHEATERKWVVDHWLTAEKKGIFIDVGADVGTWSIPMSQYFETVFAIEPSLEDVIQLQHSLTENNINNVVVIDKAANSNRLPIYLSTWGTGGEPIWYPSKEKVEEGTAVEASANKPRMQVRQKEVHSIMIDDLNLPSVRLMKIDTEGWAVDVLLGAEKKTLNNTDFVIVEVHNQFEEIASDMMLTNHKFTKVHSSGGIRFYRREQ